MNHVSARTRFTRGGIAAATSAVLLGGLAACSSGSTTTASSPSQPEGCPITVSDPWVKAADKGMTAAFGTLTNSSGAEVTITAAATPDSAMSELHEVVDDSGKMVMQPVPGGFAVPANGTLTLEPGGFHIMLMGVSAPIRAGAEVPFTLTCSGGATVQFTAPAREFAGGAEDYQPSAAPSPGMS